LGRGGFASRMLRVRHERRTSLTASLGCWHAQRCAARFPARLDGRRVHAMAVRQPRRHTAEAELTNRSNTQMQARTMP